MTALFRIPLAYADYIARFDRPCINIIGRGLPEILQRVLDALAPYKVRLADCEVSTTGPLPDHKITFKIPQKAITLHVSAESFRFTKENPYWAEKEEVLKLIDLVESLVLELAEATIASRSTILAIHLQMLAVPREEILARFIPEPFRSLVEPAEMVSFGNHLKWKDSTLIIDYSAAVANGIFARLISESEKFASAEAAFSEAREQQLALYRILDVAEDIDATTTE